MLHSLNDIRGLRDPLRQFQVRFFISMTPALLLAIGQQKVASGFGLLTNNSKVTDSKILELRCTSFSYPTSKLKQTETIIAGFRRKLGTIQDKSGVWTCVATEDQNGSVLNTIQSWHDLIHNPFTGIKLPSTLYVSTCQVEIVGAHNKEGRKIWLKGFYPIEYNVGVIDASSSNPVDVTIKFNYDWWTETGLATGISGLFSKLGA